MTADGIYLRGAIDYWKIDAENYSTLKEMGKSPRHYEHRRHAPRKDKPHLFKGRAAHVAILEPDRFMCDYILWEEGDRRGKAWTEFKAEHADKEILKPEEFATAMAMRDAVRADPVAGPLLRRGQAEVGMVWTDPETGLRCKGRMDWLSADTRKVDVKTCRNIASHAFGSAAASYAYHVQSAFYEDGYHALTRSTEPSVIVAVEAEAPHDVVVYTLDEEVMGLGRDTYQTWLARVKECRATGQWPGYAGGVAMPLVLPRWALKDDDNEIQYLDLDMGEAA